MCRITPRQRRCPRALLDASRPPLPRARAARQTKSAVVYLPTPPGGSELVHVALMRDSDSSGFPSREFLGCSRWKALAVVGGFGGCRGSRCHPMVIGRVRSRRMRITMAPLEIARRYALYRNSSPDSIRSAS